MQTGIQKDAQRKMGCLARRALTETQRVKANRALCQNLALLDDFCNAHTIMLYAAFGSEADLAELAVWAAERGKTVAYPVCTADFQLIAAVPDPDGWEKGMYGIRTPVLERSRLLAPEQLDLVLVPCTAFDAECHRIGMGKGYYDRFLQRCTQVKKIGVAYEAQRVGSVAVEPHDQRLDAFVTERGIYTWK